MRDTGRFYNLTGGEGSSSGAGSSTVKEEVKEELEEEDKKAALAWEYEWFYYHRPL
jgi:hypothetical protein